MRNISFTHTQAQMYLGTKTVTRRMGVAPITAGKAMMAIEKGQGLKKGEKIQRICPILITSVRSEMLQNITDEDVALEGFPHLDRGEFIRLFCEINKCSPNDSVRRIEFVHSWTFVVEQIAGQKYASCVWEKSPVEGKFISMMRFAELHKLTKSESLRLSPGYEAAKVFSRYLKFKNLSK
jgi:hypothetical protein